MIARGWSQIRLSIPLGNSVWANAACRGFMIVMCTGESSRHLSFPYVKSNLHRRLRISRPCIPHFDTQRRCVVYKEGVAEQTKQKNTRPRGNKNHSSTTSSTIEPSRNRTTTTNSRTATQPPAAHARTQRLGCLRAPSVANGNYPNCVCGLPVMLLRWCEF